MAWQRGGEGGSVALIEAASGHGLHKLTSRVFPENVASRSLLRRLGFDEIGIIAATDSSMAIGEIVSSSSF